MSDNIRTRIMLGLIPVLLTTFLAFSVWALDSRIDQRVQDRVQVLDARLQKIEQQLSAVNQRLEDLKRRP